MDQISKKDAWKILLLYADYCFMFGMPGAHPAGRHGIALRHYEERDCHTWICQLIMNLMPGSYHDVYWNDPGNETFDILVDMVSDRSDMADGSYFTIRIVYSLLRMILYGWNKEETEHEQMNEHLHRFPGDTNMPESIKAIFHDSFRDEANDAFLQVELLLGKTWTDVQPPRAYVMINRDREFFAEARHKLITLCETLTKELDSVETSDKEWLAQVECFGAISVILKEEEAA